MKASDLDLRELWQYAPKGGVHRFAGERAIILDTVALGFLRRELIETVGLSVARGVMTRFGYAHGRRVAEMLKERFPWDSRQEWQLAGKSLHALQGLVISEVRRDPDGQTYVIWRDSYEAEQHLLHYGRSDESVCWSLCGYASAYLSYVHGVELYCREEQCVGRGDAQCRMVAREREAWGDALPEIMACYSQHLDETLDALTAALASVEARLRSRRHLLEHSHGAFEIDGMVLRSEAMRRVVDVTRRVAKVDSTVLVIGETGVGKERMARLVHNESARAGRAFVAINCGALPEQLLESELFGHAKGAFTGATHERAGLFETASGGTLFLDEIGELSPAMQVKLLRVLQQREVRRLGENHDRAVDIRIVAATHRDLAREVAEKRFRQDLYYRLRVVELRIPPLRERQEDIMSLARLLLSNMTERMGRDITGFTPAAMQAILRYPWPGNVRELENAIERACALAMGTQIDMNDLPEELHAGYGDPAARGPERQDQARPFGRSTAPSAVGPAAPDHEQLGGTMDISLPLADMEREYILAVLRAHRGNRTTAARQLGISSATLFRKLGLYREQGHAVPESKPGP